MTSQTFDFADLFQNTEHLLRGSENISLSDCLNGKEVVALYFSAHWCPPCKQFTPKLADIYNQITKAQKSFEIVFLSSDSTEEEFQEYYKEMPWVALPYSQRELKKTLAQKYQCSGIPYLVMIDGKTGETITLEGRSAVISGGPEAFPFTKEAIESAKQAKKLKKTQLFNNWNVLSDAIDVSKLIEKQAVAIFIGCGTGISAQYVFGALQKAYEALNGQLAVIYIPSNVTDQEAEKTFLDKMPQDWFKLSENSQVLNDMKSVFSIDDPFTIVVNGQGSEIFNEEASRIIYENKQVGFPWSKEALEQEEKKAEEALEKFKLQVKEGGLKFLEGANFLNKEKEISSNLDDLKKKDLVGLYFSGHWCGPCRSFTPKLVDEYKNLKSDGINFEIIFISSDRDQSSFDEYYAEMPWLALEFAQREFKSTLANGFQVNGIPCLIWVNPSTGEINQNGRQTISDYGAKFYPWTPELIKQAEEEKEIRLAKEKEEKLLKIKEIEQGWKDAKTVVLKNHISPGGEFKSDYSLIFSKFNTFIADVKLSNGQFYYEVTVNKMGSCPQMGWVTEGFFEPTQQYTGSGVGDDSKSFGVDGLRVLKWHDGPTKYGSEWKDGDVIGFAFDTNAKSFTSSVNGNYEAPNGIAFSEAEIKCDIPWISPGLTSSSGEFNINFGERPFKFAPPSDNFKSVHQANLESLALYD